MIELGVIIEVVQRAQYTRVSFTNQVTAYVHPGYTDYHFYGTLAEHRAVLFAQERDAKLVPFQAGEKYVVRLPKPDWSWKITENGWERLPVPVA
jgi:hypothetical protein